MDSTSGAPEFRAQVSAEDFEGPVVAILARHYARDLLRKALTAYPGGGRVAGGWMHTSKNTLGNPHPMRVLFS